MSAFLHIDELLGSAWSWDEEDDLPEARHQDDSGAICLDDERIGAPSGS